MRGAVYLALALSGFGLAAAYKEKEGQEHKRNDREPQCRKHDIRHAKKEIINVIQNRAQVIIANEVLEINKVLQAINTSTNTIVQTELTDTQLVLNAINTSTNTIVQTELNETQLVLNAINTSTNTIVTDVNLIPQLTAAVLMKAGLTTTTMAPGLPGIEFAGSGYDIILGNPLGDSTGGPDPGFRANVFNLQNQQLCPDLIHSCPVDVAVKKIHQCHFDSLSTVVTSTRDYQEALAVDASLNLDGGDVLESFKFSGSASYSSFQQDTQARTTRSFITRAACHFYNAQILPNTQLTFSTNFAAAVANLLANATSYNDTNAPIWAQFLRDFGTHYIIRVQLGGKYIVQTTYQETMVATLQNQSINIQTSLSASIFGVGTEATASFNKNTTLATTLFNSADKSSTTSIGGTPPASGTPDWIAWVQSTEDKPTAIRYELVPINNLLPAALQDAFLQASIAHALLFGALNGDPTGLSLQTPIVEFEAKFLRFGAINADGTSDTLTSTSVLPTLNYGSGRQLTTSPNCNSATNPNTCQVAPTRGLFSSQNGGLQRLIFKQWYTYTVNFGQPSGRPAVVGTAWTVFPFWPDYDVVNKPNSGIPDPAISNIPEGVNSFTFDLQPQPVTVIFNGSNLGLYDNGFQARMVNGQFWLSPRPFSFLAAQTVYTNSEKTRGILAGTIDSFGRPVNEYNGIFRPWTSRKLPKSAAFEDQWQVNFTTPYGVAGGPHIPAIFVSLAFDPVLSKAGTGGKYTPYVIINRLDYTNMGVAGFRVNTNNGMLNLANTVPIAPGSFDINDGTYQLNFIAIHGTISQNIQYGVFDKNGVLQPNPGTVSTIKFNATRLSAGTYLLNLPAVYKALPSVQVQALLFIDGADAAIEISNYQVFARWCTPTWLEQSVRVNCYGAIEVGADNNNLQGTVQPLDAAFAIAVVGAI